MTVRQVVLVSSSSVVSYTTTLGYGRHTWDFPIDNLSKFSLAVTVAGTLTLTAAVWSKTSFAFTIWRLSEGGTRRLVVGLMLSMNIAMGISALLTWVQCTPLAKACMFEARPVIYNLRSFWGAGVISLADSRVSN